MHAVPQFLLDSIDNRYSVGDSFRLRHETKNDGSPCSDGKDPCLIVTRFKDCWKYYCHRCEEHGIIFENNLSPSEVNNRLSRIVAVKKVCKVSKKLQLPNDCVPMWEYHAEIPYEAYHIFWNIGLDREHMKKYMIMWSKQYQRIIVPIHENKNLVGWIGREVYCKTKEERKRKGVAKYITQKQKGSKRLFFKAEGDRKEVVLVEDFLSAIKICDSVGVTAVSLLTTSLNNALVQEMRDAHAYVWLDGDMQPKTVRYSARLNALGVKSKAILTTKDPKWYTKQQILLLLAGEGDNIE